MNRATIFLLAATAAGAATAATPPSPPVVWAGCAGALALKAQRSADPAIGAHYSPLARRALAHAKVADNPERLSETQINGVAIAAARSFRDQLVQNPAAATAGFDKAVKLCSDSVSKLPS